ncbi:hypothetical protein [Acetobacter syzygii]|uniref:hypothetical protein n=1 Tax=Acetobacter syzygii TaxID=146476 RepID=UPI000A5DDFCD|nr:hypothetical protein [Acetobacter syzygii]GBR62564.1 hypothetical protein AA0483_0437 [Acetobacter syzygii NRIC 0483]
MTAGGYVFVHDPDIPITRKPVIWRREDTTRIISLTEAPHGFSDFLSLNFEALGRVLLDREDEAGRGVTVVGPFGTFSFLLDSPDAMKRPALVIPLDPLFRSRYYEAGRFMFRYLGFSIPYCVPPVITPVRSQLLIRCLHAPATTSIIIHSPSTCDCSFVCFWQMGDRCCLTAPWSASVPLAWIDVVRYENDNGSQLTPNVSTIGAD